MLLAKAILTFGPVVLADLQKMEETLEMVISEQPRVPGLRNLDNFGFMTTYLLDQIREYGCWCYGLLFKNGMQYCCLVFVQF